MIQNFLVTTLRNLKRQWNYTAINVVGLTFGLAAVIIIFVAVRFELSFDKQHAQHRNVYRLVAHTLKYGDKGYNPGIPLPFLEAIKKDIPEVADFISPTYAMREALISVGTGAAQKKYADPNYNLSFVTPEYFRFLDYTWVQGSPKASLSEPGQVVLSQKLATRYFGSANAVGKTLKVDANMDFVVAGIIKDPLPNTSLPFEIFLSYSSLKQYGAFTNWDDWGSSYGGGQIYLRLPAHFSKQQFEKRMAAFSKKYLSPRTVAETAYILQPLDDIHFNTNINNYTRRAISKGMIWTMASVGIFILITACINFINLSVAQSLRRAREVGVRKALGSTRLQLLRQFLAETGFTTVVAVLLALLTAQLSLPYVANVLNIESSGISLFKDPSIPVILLALAAFTTLVAGAYPAFVVSSYQPTQALKGKGITAGQSQNNLRRGLIVAQFTISQAVLIGTLVAYNQMNHFRTANTGFESEQIVNVPMPDNSPETIQKLKSKLNTISGLSGLTFSSFSPMSRSNWQTQFRLENSNEPLDFEVVMRPADTAFVSTYGIKLIAGRMYQQADTASEYVINEAFAKKIGLKRPEDALGKRIGIGESGALMPIVGVVKDFNTYTMHREIIPCVLGALTNQFRLISFKVGSRDPQQTLKAVEKSWEAQFPNELFKYEFFDEKINHFYEKELRFFQLFQILAGIALFIGCLGLYGVVAFMAQSRTKEMGVRKAIGATTADIFSLFTLDFAKLILVALLIASPIAWYLISQWMEEFAFRIQITPMHFIIPGFTVLLLAFLTISFQSLQLASLNPVKSLRNE